MDRDQFNTAKLAIGTLAVILLPQTGQKLMEDFWATPENKHTDYARGIADALMYITDYFDEANH